MAGLQPRRYLITVQGRVADSTARSFEGMTLEHGSEETTLAGEFVDQSQLYGVIDRLRELGLELVRVEEAAE